VPGRYIHSIGSLGLAAVHRSSKSHGFGFEHREDAEWFRREFRERLADFELELHPEKTRLIEFGRFAQGARQKRGEGKPETFTFLGFTHYCATNSKGHFVIRRKTMGQRMRATLQAIKAELRKRLHEPVNAVGQWLKTRR
jgi:RNA-directed DNA polymerase